MSDRTTTEGKSLETVTKPLTSSPDAKREAAPVEERPSEETHGRI
jgi:hypothetical protein